MEKKSFGRERDPIQKQISARKKNRHKRKGGKEEKVYQINA